MRGYVSGQKLICKYVHIYIYSYKGIGVISVWGGTWWCKCRAFREQSGELLGWGRNLSKEVGLGTVIGVGIALGKNVRLSC